MIERESAQQEVILLPTGATVYSYYEDHALPPEHPQGIPATVKNFFIEISNVHGLGSNQTPSYIISTNNQFGEKLVSPTVQRSMERNDGHYCIADFNTPEDPLFIEYLATGFMASLPIGIGLKQLIAKNVRFSRRSFLKLAAATAPFAIWEFTKSTRGNGFLNDIIRQNKAGALDDHFAKELVTLKGRLHPEDLLLFFRSLLWAHKIISYSEDVDEGDIGVQSGTAHVITEYFLEKGKSHCQEIIKNFPPDVLRKVIDVNNGLANICKVLHCPVENANDPNAMFHEYFDKDLFRIIGEIIKD